MSVKAFEWIWRREQRKLMEALLALADNNPSWFRELRDANVQVTPELVLSLRDRLPT